MKANDGHHQPTGEYPMAYGWIIDKDHIADGEAEPGPLLNAVGLVGPRDIAHAIETRLKAGEGEPFRHSDDTGDLDSAGRNLGHHTGREGRKERRREGKTGI